MKKCTCLFYTYTVKNNMEKINTSTLYKYTVKITNKPNEKMVTYWFECL